MSTRPETVPSNRVASREPLPGSRKVYVPGPQGTRVPFREIPLHPTRGLRGEVELNAPLRVYDTSGPYTDPDADVDLARGLPELRRPWVLARGRARRDGAAPLGPRRPRADAAPKGFALAWECHADALGAKGRRDAGDGVRRDPREPRPRVRPERGRARPRDHPREREPPGVRADGDRPQLPREDQREHRQLGGHVVDRRRGREDDVGDPLGRRHRHGPLDRKEHPRDARVDPAQRAGADRDGPDLPGAREGGREGGGPDVGGLPRHADRAGGAGGRLLHDPRRRAPALHPAHGKTRHRDRFARRLDHGEVVPRAARGELPLHEVRRDLRNHEEPTTSLSLSATACAPVRRPTRTTRRSSPSSRRSAS